MSDQSQTMSPELLEKALKRFNPWESPQDLAALIDEGQLAQAERVSLRDRAGLRWSVAHAILTERKKVENGDRALLLQCVYLCFVHRLPIPEWLSQPFVDRCAAAYFGDVSSWDEAFGTPHPPGTHVANLRHLERVRIEYFLKVRELLQKPNRPAVDKIFWEEQGAPFGFGATRAEEVFRETARMFNEDPAKIIATASKVRQKVRPRRH